MLAAPVPRMGPETPFKTVIERYRSGDRDAEQELYRRAIPDLRRIAEGLFRKERPGHTLQPTILVHDALMRLRGASKIDWNDYAHFCAFAARNMRQILIDYWKYKNAKIRKPVGIRVPLEDVGPLCIDDVSNLLGTGEPIEIERLERALDAVANLSPLGKRQADGVILRVYGGGMTDEEVACVLGISETTAKSDWRAARAWMRLHYGVTVP